MCIMQELAPPGRRLRKRPSCSVKTFSSVFLQDRWRIVPLGSGQSRLQRTWVGGLRKEFIAQPPRFWLFLGHRSGLTDVRSGAGPLTTDRCGCLPVKGQMTKMRGI